MKQQLAWLTLKIGIVAYFGCLAQVHAGEPERKNAVFRVGGELGAGLVDWVGKNANGSVPGREAVARPGIAAGVFATLNLSSLLSLDSEVFRLLVQPELVYSTKGAQFERDGEDSSTIAMSYLLAGFLFRAEYSAAGRVTPYVLLGSEMGFLLSAESENRFGMTSDIKNNFKSTDLGLVLGVGTMFELPPYGALGLEVRADLGLVSIDGQGDGDEIRNAALTLMLAYLY